MTESTRNQAYLNLPLAPRDPAPASPQPDMVWGASEAMHQIRSKLPDVSSSDCPVLILGETGTGKGMLAREIHAASRRRDLPFVHVDCAALGPSMIESELYGHERGAFTGALARRRGRFELAAQGTVFLDEIAELPSELQVKLLRVLQERCFERVGGSTTIRLGARIVAATNRSLGAEIEENRFRSDLYFRLAVVEMELPPLRNRVGDIPDLIKEARRVISLRSGRIVAPPSEEATARLVRHPWPGNSREIFNLVERIAACWPDRPFDAPLAEEALRSPRSVSVETCPFDSQSGGTDRIDLERLLNACEGNVSLASRKLGVSRSTLRRRLGRLLDTRLAKSRQQLELPLTGGSPFYSG